MATYYLLKTTGLSGGVTRTWTVPAGKVAVSVRCYGGGSGPLSGYHYGGGGGAFAYNAISSGVAGTVFHYYVGVGGYNGNSGGHTPGNGGGGNTWFGATTFAAAICAANGANLSPGSSGPGPWGADYHGGVASTSIGSVKFAGGQGGDTNLTSNGGGGCAGPLGPGGAGGQGYHNKGLGGGGGANNGHAGYNASSSSQIGGAGGASGSGGSAARVAVREARPPIRPTAAVAAAHRMLRAERQARMALPGRAVGLVAMVPAAVAAGSLTAPMFGGGVGGASTANKTGGQGGIVRSRSPTLRSSLTQPLAISPSPARPRPSTPPAFCQAVRRSVTSRSPVRRSASTPISRSDRRGCSRSLSEGAPIRRRCRSMAGEGARARAMSSGAGYAGFNVGLGRRLRSPRP